MPHEDQCPGIHWIHVRVGVGDPGQIGAEPTKRPDHEVVGLSGFGETSALHLAETILDEITWKSQ